MYITTYLRIITRLTRYLGGNAGLVVLGGYS